MFDKETYALAEQVVSLLKAKKLTLTTAESCTGGLIGGAITSVPGSSSVYTSGFITYSNQSKFDMLGVKLETLHEHGAVSRQTAEEMALGAKKAAQTDIAVSVTGIAGPTGATETKPLGLVCIAITKRASLRTRVQVKIYNGSREEVRLNTLKAALRLIYSAYSLEDDTFDDPSP